MLDINLIREHVDAVKEGVAKKGVDSKIVDKLLRRDEAWREKAKALDDLKAEQNEVTKEIAKKHTKGALSRAGLLKQQITKLSDEETHLKQQRDVLLEKLPNIPFDDVPVGKNDKDNVELRQVGKQPEFDFKPKDYLTVAEQLGIIDVKRAAVVAGSRFGYLLGGAARLEFALIQFAIETITAEGFIPVVPPVMIRPEIMRRMGKGTFIDDHDAFHIDEDDLYLVGSSEHTIGPLHIDETLREKDLPRRYVGFSTCFRREAGSYGRDTRGILRVHQFDKVEMFSFVHPEKSEEEHQFLLAIQERLMQKLELPYRVVEVCTGDMTWSDARQYDIETWLPSEKQYRETHSCSNTTDFQARGIRARFIQEGMNKPQYMHTLNATGFAIGRTIVAIIENYQTKQGTVRVPLVLQSWTGSKEINVI